MYLPMWCAQCVADGLAFPEPCECESLHSLNIADATLARGEAQQIKLWECCICSLKWAGDLWHSSKIICADEKTKESFK